MNRLLFASLCLACAAPASGQDMTGAAQPWWETDPAYGAADGPALAPTEDADPNAPYADGTELSRLTGSIRPPQRDVTISDDDLDEEGSAATVLADYFSVSEDRTLTASGGVVVWYDGARLVADRVRYDGETGEMTITGPIHLTRPGDVGTEDDAILIADQAQLSQDMRDGLLRGARLVLAREMQMAATEITLTGNGRFTTLDNVVASSCQICAEDPTPLWEIRARRITHDDDLNMLRFEHPQLRAFGLPIGSWPGTVTAPDPTVERMSGLLRPRWRTTSKLGFGVMQPYFKTLGPHADLTVTPYLSASRTTTLMMRYRQAFWNGATEWNGAITRDDIRDGETRGYLFGAAQWELPRGYELGIQVQMASDDDYLRDYDITDADRLWSGLTLQRVTSDKLVWARVGNYQSLRDDEDDSTSPTQVADAIWIRRWRLGGGDAGLEWSTHAHRRPSGENIIGRDVARASVSMDWRGTRILPGGVVANAATGLDTDFYAIRDDERYDNNVVRTMPWVSATLRYPLTGSDGYASYVLEPVAQLVWSGDDDKEDEIPNEDSRQIEFDEGNLFALSRYPGWDARETGLRANLGMTWTRFDPAGWSLAIAGGRVFRDQELDDEDAPMPLRGKRSDWLLAGHYSDISGLSLSNRALFDDDFDINRDELRLGWARPGLELSLGYLWMKADQFEDRNDDLSELTGEIGWQVAQGWWATAFSRHDLEESRAQEAGLGLAYQNECISVELAASRNFIDTENTDPETDIDLSIRLGGFGRQPENKGTVARRSCLR
ncbi:LPS assembly protein LptD [Paracoccus aerodenitrificans]|uniref:LPS assembly protein LptD n=1 Tax=Paracoccus aerodenitrificans TaxID=3017781 RepID=UPI0022F0B9D1|nr:LPS assembly protein LptD [Paracoccus aerodenitrificans]WBU64165.1 LPS assembly protein LptD [Paracoccus aerodenitrificans]